MNTATEPLPTADDTVADVLGRWPAAFQVFKRNGMGNCLGCSMAAFESLAEACTTYGHDVGAFLEELNQAVREEAH